MRELILRAGRIVTPTGVVHGGVAIAGGKLAAVGPDGELGKAHREIDLRGKVVLPGLFDPHTHFGIRPPFTDDAMAEDFRTETKDAALGGVTMIATTCRIGADTLETYFDRAVEAGSENSWVDFKINAVVNTDAHIEEIPAVISKGAAYFKFFTGYKGDQPWAPGMREEGITPDFLFRGCEKIAQGERPAFAAIHAEDPWIREMLIGRMRKQRRRDLLTAWAEHSPEYGESMQLVWAAYITRQWGIPLYPVHISCAHTVETIRDLKEQGYPIVAETLTAFLSATAPELDAAGQTMYGKVQPPIRFEKDKERLWRGIQEGTISTVGTDAVNYTKAFKTAKPFWDQPVGLNTHFNCTVPLLYTEGVEKGRIDLVTLAKITSENACRAYNLYPRKGAILPGADADLVVVDPEAERTLSLAMYRGASEICLFEGRKVRGIPVMTFLRGSLVAEDGEMATEAPGGHFVF